MVSPSTLPWLGFVFAGVFAAAALGFAVFRGAGLADFSALDAVAGFLGVGMFILLCGTIYPILGWKVL
jgi:hypothetical protein